jgi:hypothetical protein
MSSTRKETSDYSDSKEPATTAAGSVISSRARVLVVLTAIAMLVLGLLGGWLLASDGDDSATWGGEIDEATLAEIDQLLDDYWAAWDAGDGQAVVAVMATDGWFSSANTAQGGYSGDQLASYVDRYEDLEFTPVGPTTVIETAAGYEVAGAERVDEWTPEPLWALDHFVIVEEDGQLRIASHQVISTV